MRHRHILIRPPFRRARRFSGPGIQAGHERGRVVSAQQGLRTWRGRLQQVGAGTRREPIPSSLAGRRKAGPRGPAQPPVAPPRSVASSQPGGPGPSTFFQAAVLTSPGNVLCELSKSVYGQESPRARPEVRTGVSQGACACRRAAQEPRRQCHQVLTRASAATLWQERPVAYFVLCRRQTTAPVQSKKAFLQEQTVGCHLPSLGLPFRT